MNSAITYEQRVWPDLVGRLLDCNYKDELNTEIDRHLIPVPWTNDGRLTVPYGDADLPYLKRSLFSSDSVLVGNSLQALVERAHKCRKAVDMLKLGVLLPVNRLTRHAEPFVRQQCCALIRVLAGQPFGKETAVRDAALVRNLLALMADTVYGVRLYGTAAVLALAEHRLGNETMVELSCADRALYRAYVEPDDRVTLTALRVVGRLMATNRTARDRTNGTAASLGRFFGGIGHGDGDDGGSTIGRPGRALIDRLIRDVRSPDYRTALDAVTGLARAVVVPEVNGYVARDRDTVDLLTSFVLSPVLRKRALRPLSVRLLCSLANTAAGLGNLRASMPPATADNLASCRSDDNDDDDPKTKRYLRKLAAATASGSIQK